MSRGNPGPRIWNRGDPEPPNRQLRAVTGRSGRLWFRSDPNGLFWFPYPGGRIHDWPSLLAADAPLTEAQRELTLF